MTFAPAATSGTSTLPSLAGSHQDAGVVTRLFSAAPAALTPFPGQHAPASLVHALSPAAAYQDALYERVLLVDVRPAHVRRHEGELDPRLDPEVLSTDRLALLGSLARRTAVPTPDPVRHHTAAGTAPEEIVLVCSDGAQSARAVWALTRFGNPHVKYLRGGFTAWQAAGMPVAAAHAAVVPAAG